MHLTSEIAPIQRPRVRMGATASTRRNGRAGGSDSVRYGPVATFPLLTVDGTSETN